MKRFIDNEGTFEVKVPDHWRYSLKIGKIHTFQDHEIGLYDTFQISINNVEDNTKRKNFFDLIKTLSLKKINKHKYYSFPDKVGSKFIVKTWIGLIDKKVVVFSLTSSIKTISNLEKKTSLIYKIISSFSLIDNENSKSELNSYRFETFLKGVAATDYMLNKAVEGKSFIEVTCILASQIDALLRTGIILQKQLINKDTKIETKWIYQGPNDKMKSEKDIYKKALELKIFDKIIFDELYELYNDRNRIIHRFIISEISLAEVEEISYKYYEMQQKIKKTVYDIESKQIELNIGMTKQGSKSKIPNPIKFIKGKIGKISYFNDKKETLK
ncbi:hypothetical protein ACFLZH_05095 [Patescibacteria group bacterium]